MALLLELLKEVKKTQIMKLLKKLKLHIEKELKQIAKLDYQQNDKISTGYKITCGDLQLDATLENQFDRLRKDILAN